MKKAALGGAALTALTILALAGCTSPAPMQEPIADATTATSPAPAATPTATEAPEPAAGTRDNPIPIDTTTEYDPASMWNFSVGATNADATQTVLDENPYNEPPAEGSVFIMTTFQLAVKPTADANGGDPGASLNIDYVTSKGNTFNVSNGPCGVIPAPEIWNVGVMYPGATASFNHCVAVPADAVAGGVWRVSSIVDPSAFIFLDGA